MLNISGNILIVSVQTTAYKKIWRSIKSHLIILDSGHLKVLFWKADQLTSEVWSMIDNFSECLRMKVWLETRTGSCFSSAGAAEGRSQTDSGVSRSFFTNQYMWSEAHKRWEAPWTRPGMSTGRRPMCANWIGQKSWGYDHDQPSQTFFKSHKFNFIFRFSPSRMFYIIFKPKN